MSPKIYIEKAKALPLPVKLLIGGGVLLLIWNFFRYKPSKEQKDYLDSAKSALDWLASEKGIIPSLTLSNFKSLVAQIVSSIDKCGTDEDTIYRSFEALNNEADIYQLIVSYGVASYDGCFEGSLPSWNVNYTLAESLASDLTSDQVSRINEILQRKKINFYF